MIGYLTDEEEENFDKKFAELLMSVDVPHDVLDASSRLCRVVSHFSDDDGIVIRKYFHSIGNDVLALQDKFPFA